MLQEIKCLFSKNKAKMKRACPIKKFLQNKTDWVTKFAQNSKTYVQRLSENMQRVQYKFNINDTCDNPISKLLNLCCQAKWQQTKKKKISSKTIKLQ